FRLNQAFVQELLYSPVAEGLLQFQDRGDPGRHRLCGRCNGRLRAGFRASYPACLPISHAANLSGESISEISSFLSAVSPVRRLATWGSVFSTPHLPDSSGGYQCTVSQPWPPMERSRMPSSPCKNTIKLFHTPQGGLGGNSSNDITLLM